MAAEGWPIRPDRQASRTFSATCLVVLSSCPGPGVAFEPQGHQKTTRDAQRRTGQGMASGVITGDQFLERRSPLGGYRDGHGLPPDVGQLLLAEALAPSYTVGGTLTRSVQHVLQVVVLHALGSVLHGGDPSEAWRDERGGILHLPPCHGGRLQSRANGPCFCFAAKVVLQDLLEHPSQRGGW